MDVDRMLKALYQERELLSRAIVSLENLVRGKKRRGRPPRWLREGRHGPPSPRLSRDPQALPRDG